MDIVGWVIGGISIVIGIAGILDARRQRNIVERLSQHQSETIQNLHGFLLGLKSAPTVSVMQVNDRLQFIKDREAEFKRIAAGGR